MQSSGALYSVIGACEQVHRRGRLGITGTPGSFLRFVVMISGSDMPLFVLLLVITSNKNKIIWKKILMDDFSVRVNYNLLVRRMHTCCCWSENY